jgi:hypothetical protein
MYDSFLMHFPFKGIKGKRAIKGSIYKSVIRLKLLTKVIESNYKTLACGAFSVMRG